jgi:hypothetical protein
MIIYGYDESQAKELTTAETHAAAALEANRKRVLNEISAGNKSLSRIDMALLHPQEKLDFAHAGGQIK